MLRMVLDVRTSNEDTIRTYSNADKQRGSGQEDNIVG